MMLGSVSISLGIAASAIRLRVTALLMMTLTMILVFLQRVFSDTAHYSATNGSQDTMVSLVAGKTSGETSS